MKKIFPTILVFASLGVVGCEDRYSKEMKYAVRTDPLVLDKAALGDERVEPDRPGTLPLLAIKDLQEPFNPIFPKRTSVIKENKLRDPTSIDEKTRKEIGDWLTEYFGTPASPYARVDPDVKEALKLQDEPLEHGSYLYRIHCLHCHGVTGDGRGPTGRWVNPHPRDYRQGVFKFMSVDQTLGARPPRREDLYRVLHEGVEGTAMPSFALLPAADLEDLVSYVIHLSIRGKVEFDTIVNAFSYDQSTGKLTQEQSVDEAMPSYLQLIARAWYDSQKQDNAVKVPEYQRGSDEDVKKSLLRGFHFFKGEGSDALGVSKKDAEGFKCISCHTDYGRKALFKFDEWGTLTKPRDLTQGVYRGGRRPVDVYYRIHSGISGSGMNHFGKISPKPEDIWDLVNFVQALPYAAMRKSAGIVID
jgi:mono/diheme cytochrome c family protein